MDRLDLPRLGIAGNTPVLHATESRLDIGSDNQRRVLFTRVIASAGVFTIFVIMAVSWVITKDPTLQWALFIPLVGSVLVLPREVVSDDLSEEGRAKMKLWLSYVRVAYFLLAIFVMLGLPELLN